MPERKSAARYGQRAGGSQDSMPGETEATLSPAGEGEYDFDGSKNDF
jgi:hypothetical protein